MSTAGQLTTLAMLLAAALPAAAGNVAVDVDDGHVLRLTGDAEANSVEVSPGPEEGSVRVVGLDGTTVGGQPERVVTGAHGLRADLGSGDDRIEIRRLTWDRDVRIRGEDGDDTAILVGVVVRGRTAWIGGAGNDRLDVDGGCVLRRAVKVRGQAGRDVVTIKDARLLGPVSVRTHRGDDDVIFRRSAFAKEARTNVVTGGGEDVVTFDTCTIGCAVVVGTGRHEDFVRVVDSHANASFRVGMGEAGDRLNLDDTTFNKDVRLDGDSGRDTLDTDGDVRFRGAERQPDRYAVRIYSFERRR